MGFLNTIPPFSWAFRLSLIIALALAAFAHTPATSAAIAKAQYATAYALPDGSVPILCEPSGGEHNGGFAACVFCLIAAGAALTDIGASIPCAITFTTTQVQFGGQTTPLAYNARQRMSGAPRAPPHAIT